jgi:peptide/nickel transport system substrate-binding protein
MLTKILYIFMRRLSNPLDLRRFFHPIFFPIGGYMLKKLLVFLSLLIVTSMLLTACGTPQQATTEAPAATEAAPATTEAAPAQTEAPPAEKTTLIYAIGIEPETYFPGYESSAIASYGFELVFNNLATKDLQGNWVGDLAESWEISDDHLTWTFHLVQNATWHDGEPFTANDVRYTFELLADPLYTGTYYTMIESIAGAKEKHDGSAQSISGINVIDDFTIALTYAQPNALVLDTMAGIMPILPEHILKDIPVPDLANSDFARNPIGTGPYMLREWNSEESLIFDKNPNYFSTPAVIDTFIWQIIPEPSAQITALLNGEVDLINVSADDFGQVENVDGVSTKTTPGSRYYMINFHNTDPLLADVRTRQAIAHAIDREALLMGIFGGKGVVENCIFHPSLPEYDPNLTGYNYDVELAKQMLAEVGWTDTDGDGILDAHGVEGVADGTKFVLELGSMTPVVYVKYNELIQQFLKAIGIDSTINPVETDIFFSTYFAKGGPWQMNGTAWSNLIGSPQQELLWNITCDSNSQYDYCNPELDDMIAANNTIFDQAQYVQNMYAILDIMQRDAIYLPTMRPQDNYAYDASLVLTDYQSAMDLYRSLPTWTWK